MAFDLETVRAHFPALSKTDDGTPRIHFDNPAGTQVPSMVVERMSDCLFGANANLGGGFRTSRNADTVVADAHAAMADMLNAASPDEIVYGQNMTTLTFHVSRSIGRAFSEGDEIIVSRMDHDANIYPWLLMARDHGLIVRWLEFDREACEFDLAELDTLLNERTRLVCVGGASNLLGTLNDVAEVTRRAHAVGAWTYIDAVQSAPHVSTDVQAIGCDFLACSAYKFFGPHQGILYGRREHLESLEAYKLRASYDTLPWKFETGTQSHEGMAGTAAAVDYFALIGETMAIEQQANYPHFDGRRKFVHAALDCLFEYEKTLADALISRLESLPGVTVHGVTDPSAADRRVPTVAFSHASMRPEAIAKALADRNIFVWSGHNYAVEVVKSLGLEERGGVVRVGPVHYNSVSEIETLSEALETILD
jgi:cysteine desulfurase family protein (TIGR01976 family)